MIIDPNTPCEESVSDVRASARYLERGCRLVRRPPVWTLAPGRRYDSVSWEVVLLFYGVKVVDEARVEGAVTGDETEYYCICTGADASFGAELT